MICELYLKKLLQKERRGEGGRGQREGRMRINEYGSYDGPYTLGSPRKA